MQKWVGVMFARGCTIMSSCCVSERAVLSTCAAHPCWKQKASYTQSDIRVSQTRLHQEAKEARSVYLLRSQVAPFDAKTQIRRNRLDLPTCKKVAAQPKTESLKGQFCKRFNILVRACCTLLCGDHVLQSGFIYP